MNLCTAHLIQPLTLGRMSGEINPGVINLKLSCSGWDLINCMLEIPTTSTWIQGDTPSHVLSFPFSLFPGLLQDEAATFAKKTDDDTNKLYAYNEVTDKQQPYREWIIRSFWFWIESTNNVTRTADVHFRVLSPHPVPAESSLPSLNVPWKIIVISYTASAPTRPSPRLEQRQFATKLIPTSRVPHLFSHFCVILFTYTGYPIKPFECKPQQLTAIGNRLLDWFSVIMADNKKRRQHVQKSKGNVDWKRKSFRINSTRYCFHIRSSLLVEL